MLEDRLQQQASWSLEHEPLAASLDLLWRQEDRQPVGLLAQVGAYLPRANLDQDGQGVQRVRAAITAFLTAAEGLVAEDRGADQSGGEAFGAVQLADQARALASWGTVAEAWNTLERRLGTLAQSTAQVAQSLRAVPGADSLAMELAAQSQQLRLWMRRGHESIVQPREGMVYWIRPPQTFGRRPRSNAPATTELPSLHGSPTNLSHLGMAALLGAGKGVVITGTALAVDGHFEVTLERLGLPPSTSTLLSPANYAQQTLLLIPSDAPEPNAPAFQRGLQDAIVEVVSALGGNTVVLLASHTALRTTAAAIRPLLESRDIMVLAQGIDGSLRQLWQNFRTQPRVVILGAGNMWDGWESDGARPQCLFIGRLPMPALNDPLQAARATRYQDAMHQFVVPQAALRLRQALNRMAWEHAERNVVVLYDRRVHTKDYGAALLNSLPTLTTREESMTMLGSTARHWLWPTTAMDAPPDNDQANEQP